MAFGKNRACVGDVGNREITEEMKNLAIKVIDKITEQEYMYPVLFDNEEERNGKLKFLTGRGGKWNTYKPVDLETKTKTNKFVDKQ
jgi:hypothetical protein